MPAVGAVGRIFRVREAQVTVAAYGVVAQVRAGGVIARLNQPRRGVLVVRNEIVGHHGAARNLERDPIPKFHGVAQLTIEQVAVAAAQAHRQAGVAEGVLGVR
jgi:hypothetical protein